MTMALRERALQEDLMRWDDNRGPYALTGTGRRRINSRSHKPAIPSVDRLTTELRKVYGFDCIGGPSNSSIFQGRVEAEESP
jgi:hypothetical protein